MRNDARVRDCGRRVLIETDTGRNVKRGPGGGYRTGPQATGAVPPRVARLVSCMAAGANKRRRQAPSDGSAPGSVCCRTEEVTARALITNASGKSGPVRAAGIR